jgi:hypothetical protein
MLFCTFLLRRSMTVVIRTDYGDNESAKEHACPHMVDVAPYCSNVTIDKQPVVLIIMRESVEYLKGTYVGG